MAKAAIQVSLRGGEALGNMMRFDPGGRLDGVVQVLPDGNIRAKRVLVQIAWHTEGRGTRAEGTAGQVEIAQGNLVANTPIVQSFAFNLPAAPWSFAGLEMTRRLLIVLDDVLVVDRDGIGAALVGGGFAQHKLELQFLGVGRALEGLAIAEGDGLTHGRRSIG